MEMSHLQHQDNPTAFTRLIDSLLPMAILKRRNPYFERQYQRLLWPPARMTSHFVPISRMTLMRRYTYIGCLAAIVIGLPGAAALLRTDWLTFVPPLTGIVSIFGLLADVVYMVTAVNSIVPQIKSEQWELLRLTSLSERDILLASYAAIQIRVWRVTVIELALRIILAMMAIAFFGNSLLHYNTDGVFYIMILLGTLVTTTGYVLEPLWRMRSIVLLAMTIAAQFGDFGMGVLISFAGVIGLVIVEAIIIAGLGLFASVEPTLTYASNVLGLVGFVIRVVLFMVGLFLFFKAINALLFRRLKRIAFRE